MTSFEELYKIRIEEDSILATKEKDTRISVTSYSLILNYEVSDAIEVQNGGAQLRVDLFYNSKVIASVECPNSFRGPITLSTPIQLDPFLQPGDNELIFKSTIYALARRPLSAAYYTLIADSVVSINHQLVSFPYGHGRPMLLLPVFQEFPATIHKQ